jgi:aspartokinase-like uncharacterized kinase
MRRVVVKVGGSLFDLPGLAGRLEDWLARHGPAHFLLVPGGGAAADVVRDLDRHHALGEEKSHWLALRALSLNARFLRALLPSSRIVSRPWRKSASGPGVLDAHAFARLDDRAPGRLPHIWEVTSDSVAARAAVVGGATELVLLKSATVQGMSWGAAAEAGLVDAHFPGMVRGAAFRVSALNFREWRP